MHNTEILSRAELLSCLHSWYRLIDGEKTSVGSFRYGFCAALLDVWHRNRNLGVRVTLALSHLWLSDFSSWHNLARSICPCWPMGISTARTSARLSVMPCSPCISLPCTHPSASTAKHSASATKTKLWVLLGLS